MNNHINLTSEQLRLFRLRVAELVNDESLTDEEFWEKNGDLNILFLMTSVRQKREKAVVSAPDPQREAKEAVARAREAERLSKERRSRMLFKRWTLR